MSVRNGSGKKEMALCSVCYVTGGGGRGEGSKGRGSASVPSKVLVTGVRESGVLVCSW